MTCIAWPAVCMPARSPAARQPSPGGTQRQSKSACSAAGARQRAARPRGVARPAPCHTTRRQPGKHKDLGYLNLNPKSDFPWPRIPSQVKQGGGALQEAPRVINVKQSPKAAPTSSARRASRPRFAAAAPPAVVPAGRTAAVIAASVASSGPERDKVPCRPRAKPALNPPCSSWQHAFHMHRMAA